MSVLFGPVGALVLAVLVTGAASLVAPGAARAALERPTYTAGDRWTYVLQASLGSLPGLNASQGVFGLGLYGLVEVDVLGTAQASVGGASVPGVRVATEASGVLNGSFEIPGNASVRASGTFSSEASEIWEGRDELPTISNSSSSYVLSVTFGISFTVQARVWLNVSTSYASLPEFNLSVGETATAPFTADISVATAVSGSGFTNSNESRGTAAGTWSRQVLGTENVSVEAGAFPSHRLNQSLGTFPGLGVPVPGAAANETAWFSNDVGYYVKRQAFVNGTPVAEMRLKSYTYPAAPGGPSLGALALVVGLPLAAAAVLVLLILRRRRGRGKGSVSGTAEPVGELPPKTPGGGP